MRWIRAGGKTRGLKALPETKNRPNYTLTQSHVGRVVINKLRNLEFKPDGAVFIKVTTRRRGKNQTQDICI